MCKALLIIFFLSVFVISCKNSKPDKILFEADKNSVDVPDEEFIIPKITDDTSLFFNFNDEYECRVEFILPKDSIKGSILMLHGWNLPALQWCDSTEFCKKAIDRKFALIIPELEKCNYPLEIYPETLDQYKKYPSLTWIMDSLLVGISEHTGLLLAQHKNFVAGISTGGRGATLLSFYLPEIFAACASISGDFDITAMQSEFLYNAWFGPYEKFKERWENECFAYRCSHYVVPTYIGHGRNDYVSPVIQSLAMYDSLKYYHSDLLIKGNFPDEAKHNYDYWKSETENILDFFNQFM
jgi:pimeloyl-ACP methyl ester carboxylesterase